MMFSMIDKKSCASTAASRTVGERCVRIKRAFCLKLRSYSLIVVFAGALCSAGCNAPDLTLEIPKARVKNPNVLREIRNYSDYLETVVFVMVNELKLPQPVGKLFFYRYPFAFESSLLAAGQKAVRESKDGLGDPKKSRREDELEIAKRAKEVAQRHEAVTVRQEVFLAEWKLMQLSPLKLVQLLAHEVTHVMQNGLAAGNYHRGDYWLKESFASYIAFQVVERLGMAGYVDKQIQAASISERPTPSLADLSTWEEWEEARQKYDYLTVYRKALFASRQLAVKKGMPAVLEYFRLFSESNNEEENFTKAFGVSRADFALETNKQLGSLR